MKKEEVNRLLEKYYNGESTESEEIALRVFFSGNEVPGEFEAEKEIFSYYFSSVEVPEPSASFESDIIQKIDLYEARVKRNNYRKYFMPLIGTAAGLLIIAGSYFFFVNNNSSDDTFSDPQLAYTETMRILSEVSVKFNKGVTVLEPVGKINDMTTKSFKTINKSTGNVARSMKSLDYLKRGFDISGTDSYIK